MNAKSARLAWIQPYIVRGRARGAIPPFGSLAWATLPDGDPRKVAAICIAAEAWAVSCDPETIRRDIEDELHAAAWLRAKQDDDDETRWREEAAKVVKIATAPSFDKIRAKWAGEAS